MIQNMNFFQKCNLLFLPRIQKISESETSLKTFYGKNKKMVHLRLISGLVRKPKFHRRYLRNYNDHDPEFGPDIIFYASSVLPNFGYLNHSRKKTIEKIPRCLSSRSGTLGSYSLKLNVMNQCLVNDKESMNKNPLWGGNLVLKYIQCTR
jgi:hypothetical protein